MVKAQWNSGKTLDALPVAVLRSDNMGKIVFANRSARELFGKKVVGLKARELYGTSRGHTISGPSSTLSALQSSADRTLRNIRLHVRVESGEEIPASCYFALNVVDGSVSAVIITDPEDLFSSLERISAALAQPWRLDDVLEVITSEARRLCGADRAYLKLYDRKRDHFAFRALSSLRPSERFPEATSPLHRGMTGWVFEHRRPYSSANVSAEPPERYYTIFSDTRSKIVVPLLHSLPEQLEDSTICFGVLAVDGLRVGQFSPDKVDIIQALASHAAIALAQVDLLSDAHQTYQELLSEIRRTKDSISAANLLHDGKNMLREVTHLVESLVEDLDKKSYGKKRARELDSQLGQLKALSDLLGIMVTNLRSKSAPSLEDYRVARDVHQIMTQVVKVILLRDEDISVHVESQTEHPEVFGGQTQLLLMIYNLAVNAVAALKSSGRPGAVDLIVAETPGRPGFRRIVVKDNGPGIGRFRLNLLREAQQYSTTPGGLGVGLLSVRETIKDLGGYLDVQSVLGSGTSFTIDLPGPPSPK